MPVVIPDAARFDRDLFVFDEVVVPTTDRGSIILNRSTYDSESGVLKRFHMKVIGFELRTGKA